MTLFGEEPQEKEKQKSKAKPKNSNEAILHKIANVKKSNDGRIDKADMEFCKSVQKNYDRVKAQHDVWEMTFKAELNRQYPDGWERKSRWSGHFSISVDKSNLPQLMENQLDFEDMLEALWTKRMSLQKEYEEAITYHFIGKYHLPIRYDYTEGSKINDYNQLIDWIFSKVEVGSLIEQQVANVKNNFHSITKSKNGYAKVEKNKILLPYLSGCYSNNSTDMMKVWKAFGLFETGEADSIFSGTIEINGASFECGITHEMKGTKIDKFKRFQNGKAIIYFKEPMQANEFYSFFELDK